MIWVRTSTGLNSWQESGTTSRNSLTMEDGRPGMMMRINTKLFRKVTVSSAPNLTNFKSHRVVLQMMRANQKVIMTIRMMIPTQIKIRNSAKKESVGMKWRKGLRNRTRRE